MEKKNENPKIEELTDEQMKEVAGGLDPRVIVTMGCIPLPGCLNMTRDCNCTKCEDGYVLHLGKCGLP